MAIKMDPVIMWNPETGDQITVRTNVQYDRALAKGYVWLMDADGQEVA